MIEKRIFVVDSSGETEEKKVQLAEKKSEKSEAKFVVDEQGTASIKPSDTELIKKIREKGKEYLDKTQK